MCKKMLLRGVLFLLFFCNLGTMHAIDIKPYSFAAHFEKNKYVWGKNVVVYTTITNGDQTINYIQMPYDPYELYEITVNDPFGNNAKHTAYWQTTRWYDVYVIQHPQSTPPSSNHYEYKPRRGGLGSFSIKDVDLPPRGEKKRDFALAGR
jgi:hypothetical protein